MAERFEPIDVGMILDGNRRFARKQGLASITEGHRAGGDNFKRIMERARDEQRVRVLAAWCLSCKNLDSRSSLEIEGIFGIGQQFLTDLRDTWMDREENLGVRLLHMGRQDRMEQSPGGRRMLATLNDIAAHTRDRAGMVVALCFDYSGEDEQRRAIEAWKERGTPGASFEEHLDLPRQGVAYRPLDLMIRTGKEDGESDRSGAFLHPYMIAGETRLRSSAALFPEFTPDDFSAVLDAYFAEAKRQGK